MWIIFKSVAENEVKNREMGKWICFFNATQDTMFVIPKKLTHSKGRGKEVVPPIF